MSALAAEPHPVRWVVASPLWADALGDEPDPGAEATIRIRRPALLRFASDRFMDDLAELLAHDASALLEHRARPQSFRVRPPWRDEDWEPEGATPTLKLYGAAQGHFNLVAASLVCQIPGLPEREVRAARGDRVGFVMRRLSTSGELAWVPGTGWTAVAATAMDTVPAGEELLPMFPAGYTTEEGLRRRLFVGLIPTGSVEMQPNSGAASMSPTPQQTPQGIDAWRPGVVQRITGQLDALRKELVMPGKTPQTARDEARAAHREACAFLLLDLAEELIRHFPGTWRAILGGAPATNLATNLSTATVPDGRTWAAVLTTAWTQRDEIWGEAGQDPTLSIELEGSTLDGDTLLQWLTAEGPAFGSPAEPLPPVPGPSSVPVPKLQPGGSARYRLRCVFQRPSCGPLHPDVVSAPTDAFALASFFDPDAPARPVHIALPVNTSVRDLRKFRRSVTIALSDQLRSQMSRANDAGELIKGNLSAGEPIDLGLICSFSIPIITIVALILLMLIVILLNLIFWWLPFFRICFPVVLRGR